MNMNKIMAKLQRFGKIRQLHTIISQQTIKPATPTPSHLKTYNLSLTDKIAPNVSTDFVFFFPKYINNVNTNVLKQSLSQSLARYYPLAGRFPSPSASYVDCNDEGIDFVEVSTDSRLNDFIQTKYQHETLHHLFPKGLGLNDGKTNPSLLQVQLNHFLDGGVAVAVSMSHKIADALTTTCFVNHWATVARGESPINPTFIYSPPSNSIEVADEVVLPENTSEVIYKTRTFTFPNSKLNELKKNVSAMGNTPINPSRFEVLASLIFKCAVGASTNKSYESSLLYQPFNVRGIIAGKYPETTAGNVITCALTKMKNSGQIQLNDMVNELRKRKMEVEGLRDVKDAAQFWRNTLSTLADNQGCVYAISSTSRFPMYNVNFGWGKPLKVTMSIPDIDQGSFVLWDTPSGDGIDATARLREDEMAIFENDKEILAYVQEDV
uniref:Transferase, Chloramphenicol acetyltransferase-like domain protein n=1 Tax=Tanacetum cinerariifolium TaxID=118510 RepID=A0A699HQ85_TANCI|nr:hypothetical protein [Tanacetum cinerariifolium]